MTNIVVAVSDNGGEGASSPDGVTWTQRVLPRFLSSAAGTWTGVCFSSDLATFCAVSSGGSNNNNAVGTSTDGTTWSGGNIAGSAWRSVVWAGGTIQKFVAVGDSGVVATSPDGVTWTNRTAAEANNWIGVAYSPALGMLAAVSTGGTHQIMTSTDGITWTVQAQPSGGGFPTSGFIGITWEASLGKFCALLNNFGTWSAQSPDGTTWTGFNTGTNFGNVLFVGRQNGGGFTQGGHSGNVMVSALGTTSWTAKTGIPAGADAQDTIYDTSLGLYLTGAADSKVYSSTDLVTITGHTIGTSRNWRRLASNNQLGNAPPVPPPTTSETIIVITN